MTRGQVKGWQLTASAMAQLLGGGLLNLSRKHSVCISNIFCILLEVPNLCSNLIIQGVPGGM